MLQHNGAHVKMFVLALKFYSDRADEGAGVRSTGAGWPGIEPPLATRSEPIVVGVSGLFSGKQARNRICVGTRLRAALPFHRCL